MLKQEIKINKLKSGNIKIEGSSSRILSASQIPEEETVEKGFNKTQLNQLATLIDQKLEEKLEEKLEQKLEEKLDQKLEEKLKPIADKVERLYNWHIKQGDDI